MKKKERKCRKPHVTNRWHKCKQWYYTLLNHRNKGDANEVTLTRFLLEIFCPSDHILPLQITDSFSLEFISKSGGNGWPGCILVQCWAMLWLQTPLLQAWHPTGLLVHGAFSEIVSADLSEKYGQSDIRTRAFFVIFKSTEHSQLLPQNPQGSWPHPPVRIWNPICNLIFPSLILLSVWSHSIYCPLPVWHHPLIFIQYLIRIIQFYSWPLWSKRPVV